VAEGTHPRGASKDEPKGAERDDKAEAAVKSAPSEPRIPVTRLKAESIDFLGVEPHVVAGALHGRHDTELTVSDVRNRVQEWLSTPVEED